MHEFHQTDNPPGPHDHPAGHVDGKMVYNTECPECGTYDRMGTEYVGIPEDILEAHRNQLPNSSLTLTDLQAYKQGDVTAASLRDTLGIK